MKKIIAHLLLLFNINIIKKNEKLKIYEEALKLIEKRPEGLCSAIYTTSHLIKVYTSMYIYFPEIYIQKPLKQFNREYWFIHNDMESRIKILENAINHLTKQ